MHSRIHLAILLALPLVIVTPAGAEHFCDDPPTLTILTGEGVAVSGLESEGHPIAYSWYVTPPNTPVPLQPTSTEPTFNMAPDTPGLWSIALVTDYQHQTLGGPWSSETCVTLQATSVVAAIELTSNQIATDEELDVNGFDSQWAAGVTPQVEWQVDGQPLGSCNGGPPPANPGDLTCTIPANWLPPGWHTAGLLLTDPSSGQSSLSTGSFEVIEVVPLTVDFTWSPAEPDPGDWVHFVAAIDPQIPEIEFTRVTWDLGDGRVFVSESCPLPWASCLEWIDTFDDHAWYDVSITVETADETAFKSHPVKIGDPVDPPTASIRVNPSLPMLLETTNLIFDGVCDGQCTWSWDFGDGAQSTATNPSHAWQIPATYTVSLSVSNQGGSDFTSIPVSVGSCWLPAEPSQAGTCHGGHVWLTGAAGSAWLWSTGATVQTISAPLAGAYWVNIDDGAGCWGHTPTTVVLDNCGDPGGDANLDGMTDTADLSALIPELTDGDGDTVVGAGGGDLTAPGGDVTRDDRLRTDDLQAVLSELFR